MVSKCSSFTHQSLSNDKVSHLRISSMSPSRAWQWFSALWRKPFSRSAMRFCSLSCPCSRKRTVGSEDINNIIYLHNLWHDMVTKEPLSLDFLGWISQRVKIDLNCKIIRSCMLGTVWCHNTNHYDKTDYLSWDELYFLCKIGPWTSCRHDLYMGAPILLPLVTGPFFFHSLNHLSSLRRIKPVLPNM